MFVRFRLKARNRNLSPCRKRTCNFYRRVLKKTVKAGDGRWKQIVVDKIDMFRREAELHLGARSNYTSWSDNGRIDFIMFQVYGHNMDAGGELRLADFETIDPHTYTSAPTVTTIPSLSPSILQTSNIGYVLRYAGEVRTVVRSPFQVDKTGERLPMDRNYRLCGGTDEIIGGRLNVRYKEKCVAIRGGNPEVRSCRV